MRPAIKNGAKANLIRMLGGWRSGDVSADSCRWDGSKYVYDWSTIKKRIDQRWGAGMEELIATYGRETVNGWRFRVGTEIDTRPEHWSGTMQEYFDHYKNTVEAVHSVLPTAKVGVQFREASMKPKYVDYKGNIEPPYGPRFVEWAKKHDVHYDFIGTLFYPRYNLATRVDLEMMYTSEQAPIAEHPDWRPGATFEVHEYKPITEINEGRFLVLNTSRSAAFNAMFAKLIYEKNIPQV
jgi:hypothetical protein